MNRLRKVLLIVFSAFIVIVISVFVFLRLYLTDERLGEIAEPFLEEQLGRDVSIGGFEIKLLRALPNIAVGISEVAVHTPDRNDNPAPDLASIHRLWVELPIMPLVRGDIHVNALELDGAQILVEVYDDLSTNLIELAQSPVDTTVQLDTTVQQENTASSGAEIKLENIRVLNGQIGYVHADGTLLTLDGLNADLSARLSDLASLEGWLSIEDTYFETGGITYADHWTLGLDLLAESDLENAWLRIDKADLSVQDLVLQLTGQVDDFNSESMGIDLSLNAPEAPVASFWSLLPEYIVKDLSGLESSGTFSVKGSIEGNLAESELPQLDMDFMVANGSITYPGLPSSIRNLTLDAHLTNAALEIKTFAAEAEGAQLSANATVSNFASPTLGADIDLEIDLSSVQNYYPLDDSTALAGMLALDTQINGQLENVDALKVAGEIELSAINYASPLLEQPVEDLDGKVVLGNDQILFENISLATGESDLQLNGVLTGYEAFMADSLTPMPAPVFKGEIQSSRLNLTEQISEDTTSSFVGPLELPLIELDVRATVGQLEFNGMTLAEASGRLSMEDGLLEFNEIQARLFNGLLSATGNFDLSDPYLPSFNGGVRLQQMPVTEFFSAFSDMDAIVQLGNYLNGLFDTEASFGLKLDKDLNPMYESVVASGAFGAREGSFGTIPLQSAIANYTGVNALESLNIDDWSHSFSVSGERLHVQDLRFNAGEYAIGLSGFQGFDGGLDYRLQIELPESASNALSGAPVQGALGSISTVVNATLKDPSTGRITLDMLATGSFNDPTVRLDVDKMKARLTSSITEGIKTEAETRLDSLEQSARAQAEAELEEQRQRLEERAENEIQNLVGGLVDSTVVTTPLDSLKEQGADALKNRLNGLFNRKKRNN